MTKLNYDYPTMSVLVKLCSYKLLCHFYKRKLTFGRLRPLASSNNLCAPSSTELWIS